MCNSNSLWLRWLRKKGVGFQPIGRYVFAVGIGFTRTVTVYARGHDNACASARRILDKRAERRNEESPVAWDLTLIKMEIMP